MLLGIDRRRQVPRFHRQTLERLAPRADGRCEAVLFADTFTNHYDPDIGLAALDLMAAAGSRTGLVPHVCCGRPQISKGLLESARRLAERNTDALYPHAASGRRIVFCEPSCLSAMREDVPSLLRGEMRRKADQVAGACVLLEQFLDGFSDRLSLRRGPGRILFHAQCHQNAMGMAAATMSALSRIPEASVVDLDAGCCGMAGSFGYAKDHFEVSRAIGERKLFPAVRGADPAAVIVATGTSCRHQVKDFTGRDAVHPAVLLRSLLIES
jgi:Fe-S oxidoreductase